MKGKEFSKHGFIRGADLDRRSTSFEGRFGRIFRALPAATWTDDALKALAGDGKTEGRMTSPAEDDGHGRPLAPREDVDDNGKPRKDRLHDDEENSGIDAGYTYLGQFIDHDITFDPMSSLQKTNDLDALVDFRTPQLDLDSVYGRGPDDQPYMYEGNRRRFLLGRNLLEGPGGKVTTRDLPRHSWTDNEGDHQRALIGDMRNDENVIVSQLHSIFLQFHNRQADRHPTWKFADLQRHVRFHYQYVVLHDFLYKIARQDVIESVLPHFANGKSIYVDPPRLRFYKPRNEAFLPVEFSVAAYRFGHSMVRPIYRLNTKLFGGNVPPDPKGPNDEIHRGLDGRQFIFAGLKDRGLNGFGEFPKEWGIDWDLFFDISGNKKKRVARNRVQPAYKIDTSLVNPLAFLPEFSETNFTIPSPPLTHVSQLQGKPKPPEAIANLALRNLFRGRSMGLPCGQDVALLMDEVPLPDEALKVGKATTKEEYEELDSIVDLSGEFAGNAPLWFYILAEAQHDWLLAGGKVDTPVKLGKIGSRIVVETLVGLILDDSNSLLRQAPGWIPNIGKGKKFDIGDFIVEALDLKT